MRAVRILLIYLFLNLIYLYFDLICWHPRSTSQMSSYVFIGPRYGGIFLDRQNPCDELKEEARILAILFSLHLAVATSSLLGFQLSSFDHNRTCVEGTLVAQRRDQNPLGHFGSGMLASVFIFLLESKWTLLESSVGLQILQISE